jgi:hypothetical protein
MGYREDLEAALARVAALEKELAIAARGVGAPERQEQLAKLLQQLAETSAKVQQLQAERDTAVNRAAVAEAKTKRNDPPPTGPVPPVAPQPTSGHLKSMKSLVEHNRSLPHAGGQGMGVLCPRCLELGERVEMVRKPYAQGIMLGGTSAPGTRNIEPVWCPRCALLDFLRLAPK